MGPLQPQNDSPLTSSPQKEKIEAYEEEQFLKKVVEEVRKTNPYRLKAFEL
jgi:hypothetical protein